MSVRLDDMDRKILAEDVLEDQCRTTNFDQPIRNLGDFEFARDGFFDAHELSALLEQLDEAAKVLVSHASSLGRKCKLK